MNYSVRPTSFDAGKNWIWTEFFFFFFNYLQVFFSRFFFLILVRNYAAGVLNGFRIRDLIWLTDSVIDFFLNQLFFICYYYGIGTFLRIFFASIGTFFYGQNVAWSKLRHVSFHRITFVFSFYFSFLFFFTFLSACLSALICIYIRSSLFRVLYIFFFLRTRGLELTPFPLPFLVTLHFL